MTNSYGNPRLLILCAIATLLALAAFWPGRPAHGDSTLIVDDLPVGSHVTWRKAAGIKRALGGRVLVLDIRRRATSAADTVFDARVPFVDQEAEQVGLMTFHVEFALQADDALRAAHLTHSSPVYLVCDDRRCGDLAAALLHEHGYERLNVVSDPQNAPRRVDDEPTR